MTTSLTTHLTRLADHFGELRLRLKEAARYEVAEAVAEALAEVARVWIRGTTPIGNIRRQEDWDDSWVDPLDQSTWPRHDMASFDTVDAAKPASMPYEAALATALLAARWSLVRTGQPVTALGVAAATALVVLLGGERIRPLVDVVTTAQELLSLPSRRR